MTEAQITNAIQQVKAHCRLMDEQGNYEAVSVRGILYTLGFDEDQAQEVINRIASEGFDYCLDSTISSSTHFLKEGASEYPTQAVCYWDPTQILSRLNFIR